MTLERLRKRREELQTGLRETAIQLEQLRGAMALCDELIREAEGNGLDVSAPGVDEREDREPVG